MELQTPKEVRINSIVLIRNIGSENKREPLKFARVVSIHKSRDNAQRVVTLTYNNIKLNKKGDWIGTPVTVDRSINDLVLVDNALSDSMLGPRVKEDRVQTQDDNDGNDDGHGEAEHEMMNIDNKMDDDAEDNDNSSVDPGNKDGEIKEDGSRKAKDTGGTDETRKDIQEGNEKENNTKEGSGNEVRRSERKKIQRMTIEADDIGDCDTDNDPDYEE